MIIEEFIQIMNSIAPENLKEDFDNVGLMVGNPKDEIKSILVSLDCTLEVIDEAINKDCNLIFTHHPLIFNKPSNITTDTLLGKKIIKLIKNDINVYSAHTNLDTVIGGLNDNIMNILGFIDYDIIDRKDDCGIGRIATIKDAVTLTQLCTNVKKALNITCLRYSGDENKIIKKVAVINGSGKDYFEKASQMGAECIITGDTTYHYISDLREENIAVIDAGHFETEWMPLLITANNINDKLNANGFNNSFVISEKIYNPYKYK